MAAFSAFDVRFRQLRQRFDIAITLILFFAFAIIELRYFSL